MKSSRLFVTCVAICAMACSAGDASGTHGSEARDDVKLSASIGFLPNGGFYVVELVNRSADFLCIDEAQFDTRLSNLTVRDSRGAVMQPLTTAEPAVNNYLGFDYVYATYSFLKPGSSREVTMDVKNYKLDPGEYDVSGLATYYRCDDIIDKARIAAKREIRALVLQFKGSFRYPGQR